MQWADKTTVKKGDLGEMLVDKFLIDHNCIPYAPKADRAHPFDRLCATADKKTIFIAEVKSKARRTYYPDTGIDVSHLSDYQHIQTKHSLKVYLFFVDEGEGRIYGNWLDELLKPRVVSHSLKSLNYPLEQKGVKYFPLEAMTDICLLDADAANELKRLSTRNYSYNGEAA